MVYAKKHWNRKVFSSNKSVPSSPLRFSFAFSPQKAYARESSSFPLDSFSFVLFCDSRFVVVLLYSRVHLTSLFVVPVVVVRVTQVSTKWTRLPSIIACFTAQGGNLRNIKCVAMMARFGPQ